MRSTDLPPSCTAQVVPSIRTLHVPFAWESKKSPEEGIPITISSARDMLARRHRWTSRRATSTSLSRRRRIIHLPLQAPRLASRNLPRSVMYGVLPAAPPLRW
ncbi:hypothetical protein ONZ43_g5047 [Nemania bipapillata]|uniref:Uncharacterized protein n=1 Tax=Nemania bipapillata TaxID=110536 RepID=A0ACC2IFD1_9PEZI|nr:hypothetical protein ONZ43_g5047 [Nemania bipapillata]